MFKKSKRIKKTIKYKDLILKLFEYSEVNPCAQNIEAYDKSGNHVWTIETPTNNTQYWDMQIDEDHDNLKADSGAGMVYTINLKDGSIIKSRLIKL